MTQPKCGIDACPYDNQCADCSHRPARKNRPTGLDTSDMKAYKREWMRRWRAENGGEPCTTR